MAYAKKPGQQQVVGGAPAAGLIATGGPQTAGAAGGGAPAKGGGGYVNLQDYLRLNQGGAQQMAGKVGDFVAGEGKGVTDALAAAQGDFDAKRLAGMGTDIHLAPMHTGYAIHGEPDARLSDEELAALKRQAGQTYTGPAGLEGVDDLATKAAKASDDARMASSFGGLAGSAGAPGLISQVYGGHASQGGANLDAFLAGSTGQLGGLSAQYGKLGEALDKARTDATRAAGQARSETQRRADAARAAYEAEQRKRWEAIMPRPEGDGRPHGLPPRGRGRPEPAYNPFGAYPRGGV